MRKAKLILAVGLVLITLAVFSVVPIVHAQQTAARQQWQYAILSWDTGKSEFHWNTSVLYDEMDIDTTRDSTQAAWDILDEAGDAGMVDYLAVMGISGYDLVDIAGPIGGVFIYTFKRPLE